MNPGERLTEVELAMLSAVATVPSCAVGVLAAASSPAVVAAALACGTLDEQTRARIAAGGGPHAAWAVAGSSSPGFLAQVAADGANVQQRRALARNRHTPSGIVDTLVTDPDAATAAWACMHPATDDGLVRQRLVSDPGFGVFATECDRSAFAGAVGDAHPSTVDLLAAHPSTTFRRLACRLTGLSERDALFVFGATGSGTAGRGAWTRNPNSPVRGLGRSLRWLDADDEQRVAAAGCVDSTGHLPASTPLSWVAAADSPSADLALARALRAGLVPSSQDATRLLTSFARRANGMFPESDVVAAFLDVLPTDRWAEACGALSWSRLSGARRASVRVDVLFPIVEAYLGALDDAFVGQPMVARRRKATVQEALEAGPAVARMLSTDVEAWATFAHLPVTDPMTLTDRARAALDVHARR